ncbi:hypothetical protein FAZ98_07255 [Paraburkholderia acidisoli]|uniref:Uncharacterized protein n=2 Tax=Paraburkholderia acidisoli TaxID=2571748 RepID=A0A7Z2GJE4_9BURK|nr:hypothetical protein [Paraburkholderia acidisoli]QGZ62907.1 hypothetical protein FAZ98_07255 [Paraburkholderia acidisoli]
MKPTRRSPRGAIASWFAPMFAPGLAATLALACALPLTAQAQAPGVDSSASSVALPLKPNPEFANFPSYSGMLGNRKIVMRLGAKNDKDDTGGVHGEYQFADTGEVVLIAGDRDGTTLEAEDSHDGTHIAGNWVGTFGEDGTLSGDRMNPDDSNPVPFALKPLAAGATPSAAPQVMPPVSAPSANGQAVNGVNNLIIGK